MEKRFGDYRLKARERELIGPAGPVELSARAYDLLRALLGSPDPLLDKDALFAAALAGHDRRGQHAAGPHVGAAQGAR